jgi:hypothetical protein
MVATREQKEVMIIAQAIIYEFGQLYPEAIGRLFAVLTLPPKSTNEKSAPPMSWSVSTRRYEGAHASYRSFPLRPPISDSSAPI